MAWIGAHVVFTAMFRYTSFDAPWGQRFLLVDHSLSEFYQYGKYIAAMALLIAIWRASRRLRFAAWLPAFLYLLIDDSMRVHEIVGQGMGPAFGTTELLGVRVGHYGEALVAIGFAFIVAVPVVFAWLGADSDFRWLTTRLALLFVLLGIVGVGLDFLQSAAWGHFEETAPMVPFLLVVLEDGGELVVTSLMVGLLVEYLRGRTSVQQTPIAA